MAITTDGRAPYTSFPTLIEVIESYRNRGLQTPFTTEVLKRTGVSDGMAPRTLQSMILLDLIDEDGNPTEEFVALRKAPEDEYKQRFADIVRSAYAEVFDFVDPASADRARVRDAFRSYQPHGQQKLMVLLFLRLCEYAGIIENMGEDESNGTPRRRTVKKKVPKAPHANSGGRGNLPKPQGQDHPAFVAMLLDALPEPGAVWPRRLRAHWTNAALAAFELHYEPAPEDQGDRETG